MLKLISLTAAALMVGSITAQAQVAPRVVTSPQAQGQWYTAPNGCSYSRTQAPGQAPVWMLIKNPHHIGGKNAHRGCPSMIQG